MIYIFHSLLRSAKWVCGSMCHSVGNSWFAERPFVRFGDYVHQSQVQILQHIWMFCSVSIYLFIIFVFFCCRRCRCLLIYIYFFGHPTVKPQWYRRLGRVRCFFPKNNNVPFPIWFWTVHTAQRSQSSSVFGRHQMYSSFLTFMLDAARSRVE